MNRGLANLRRTYNKLHYYELESELNNSHSLIQSTLNTFGVVVKPSFHLNGFESNRSFAPFNSLLADAGNAVAFDRLEQSFYLGNGILGNVGQRCIYRYLKNYATVP